MRRTRRAATAALISSTAAAATLLSALVPAQAATARAATPVPPVERCAGTDYPLGAPVSPAVSLLAIWVNAAATGNVRAVILSLGPGSGLLQVHAYGFCSPVPCNWGTYTDITFGPSVVATTGGTFLAPYKFGFANKLLDGTVNAAGTRLTVQNWTEFTDHSKRSNYVSTDTFVPLR